MPRGDPAADDSTVIGDNVRTTRERNGLTASQVARSAGLTRRRLVAIERGRVVATNDELAAIANGCGVEKASLLPPGFGLRVAASTVSATATGELEGDSALDALLREYLMMVLELRNASPTPTMTLRDADLIELARALGGTPDAIEARLRELLGTDVDATSELREAILPSSRESSGAGGVLAT
ncbi:MAG TPA: helix-turn-helix transcriptional regulator [Acidimicrobiia bacterium]|nr:helix-turn-helix transcriptional regulator [Acidimicrobiia bacterium]